jgi:retron-type reverse transcriptase
LRIIDRFLKAGVLEDGVFSASEQGTPQGGLVSPVLANIYLHDVLDVWFEKRYAKSCRGKAYLVRYADDCVPRTHDLKSGKCDVAQKMRVGPSKPACRSRLQTTSSCWRQERWW